MGNIVIINHNSTNLVLKISVNEWNIVIINHNNTNSGIAFPFGNFSFCDRESRIGWISLFLCYYLARVIWVVIRDKRP